MSTLKSMWKRVVHRATPDVVKKGDTTVQRVEKVVKETERLTQLSKTRPT